MSAYKKNLLVGLVMLGALVMLGWMILKFGGTMARPLAPQRMPVHFRADRADGLDEGSAVTFRGVRVGAVTTIQRSSDEQKVIIHAEVDKEPPLPGNVEGRIRVTSAIGAGAAIDLVLTDGQPEGSLQKDQWLNALYVGLELLPSEYSELARELREAARQFRESNLIADLGETVRTTRTQVERAGKLMASLDELVSDKALRENVRQSVANIRGASETATRLAGNLEKLSTDVQGLSAEANATLRKAQETMTQASGNLEALTKQMNGRLEQIATLLDSFHSIARKIDEGKGTAGMLINDPKLYEGLVDTTRELNLALKDMQRLVEQWEQEGASIRLGK